MVLLTAACTRRGLVRFALAVLLLAPAILGAAHALRLASAAWMVGAFGEDPIVSRVLGVEEVPAPREMPGRYEKAGRWSGFDLRYPSRLGRSLARGRRSGGAPGAALLRAHELLAEACRRAPSDSISRLYLSDSALSLGRVGMADRQLLAAIELAPVWSEIAAGVERHFRKRGRFERRRGPWNEEALAAALGVPSEGGARIVLLLLRDGLLGDEKVCRIFEDSDMGVDRAIALLTRAGRWRCALSLAEGSRDRDGGRRWGRTRMRYAEYLLDLGAVASAREKAELGRSVLGEGFEDWEVLARCRFAAGDRSGGLAAAGDWLAGGVAPSRVGRILVEGGVPAEGREAFWRARRAAGDGRDTVELERGRALIDAGRPAEALEILLELSRGGAEAAEGSYLAARAFLAEGRRKMARRKAVRAVALDRMNERYRELLETLEEEVR